MEKTTPDTVSRKHSCSVWFWVSAASVALSLVIAVILFLFLVPTFEDLFVDLGAELPRATVLVLEISHFVQSYLLLLLLPLIGLSALIIWGLYALDQRKHPILVIVLGNIPPLIVIILLLPLFLPLPQLIRILTGNGP